MIVTSFRAQYGVNVYSKDFQKMTWDEFCSLLQGIGSETPLAKTVQIRLETDKDVLKNFTSSQRAIRDKWRSRGVKQYTEQDMQKVLADFQQAFSSFCG